MSANNKSPDTGFADYDFLRIIRMYGLICESNNSKLRAIIFARLVPARELDFISRFFKVEFIYENGQLIDIISR